MCVYIYIYIYIYDRPICFVGIVFANGPRDRRLITGRVIPKTQIMVLDTALLNTQHYKVQVKVKVEQSRERSCTLSLHPGVVVIENGAYESSPTLLIYIV